MAILFILTYIIFMVIMAQFAKHSVIHARSLNGNPGIDRYLIWYLLFFAFISGTRWCVGADYMAYRKQFSGTSDIHIYYENKEYLWYYFVSIINKLGLHFTIGLGITSFFQLYFIVKTLKEYKYILIALPFILFANFFFWEMMNGMRQILVASIMFYASKYIYEKKYIKYYSLLVCCYFIHHSVIILAPLFFIPKSFHIADKRTLCLIIFLICFAIGRVPQFQSIASSMSQLTALLGYDNYSERVNDFLSNDVENIRSLGPMFLSLFAMCLLNIFYAPMIRNEYARKIKEIDLWYNFSFIFCCTYFLFSGVDIVFIRPTYYFAFYLLVTVSLLLYHLYNKRQKYGALYIFVWLIIAVSMFRDMQKSALIYPHDLSIYKSIYFHN